MAEDEDLRSFLNRQVTVGSKVVGGVAGALVTLWTGLPVAGAALSPFLAAGLERAGNEVISRQLGPRQEARVGRAIIVAAELIRKRKSQGEPLRADGFFDPDPDSNRSSADEITEAILLTSMNSTEEKKVDFLAILLANLAFDASIDLAFGHLLIRTVETVSYRGLVLLRLVSAGELRAAPTRPSKAEAVTAPPEWSALQIELYDLYARGLIESKEHPHAPHSEAILGAEGIQPTRLYLTLFGDLLHRSAGLDQLSLSDPYLKTTKEGVDRLSWYGTGGPALDGGKF